MVSVYADTNLLQWNVAAHPDDARAMEALYRRVVAGEIQIFTSAVMTREVDRARDPDVRARLLAQARAVPKISPDEKVLGFDTVSDPRGGFVTYPLVSDVQDEGVYGELRRLGLDKHDAQHVAQAISAECGVFLTRDAKTILSRREKIEARFPIKLMSPPDLEAELSKR